EAEAALERRFELRARHVLAAQDAIDIERADLDVSQATLAHDGFRIGIGLDLAWLHAHLRRGLVRPCSSQTPLRVRGSGDCGRTPRSTPDPARKTPPPHKRRSDTPDPATDSTG